MPKVTKQLGGTRPTEKVNGRTTVARTGNVFEDALDIADLPDTGYKFMIFGESGSGKTTLACTFPKPLLLIRPEEVEDGSLSVRKVPGVKASPHITDPDQIADICEGQARTNRYRTIVLDGVDRLQDLVVKKHMGLADVPVQQTWGMVPQADWNRIGIMLKDYLRELMRLTVAGTHVVLVGGERTLNNDNASQVVAPRVTIALVPGCVGWVHAVMDYSFHSHKRPLLRESKTKIGDKEVSVSVPTNRSEFCLHMGNEHPLYAVKFRVDRDDSRKLPEVMVNADFTKLSVLIEGGK